MSAADREADGDRLPFQRPYACRGCGTAMRIAKGAADGYCLKCCEPTIVCCGFLDAFGRLRPCDRVLSPGGVHGRELAVRQCPDCRLDEQKAARARGRLEASRRRREAASFVGPPDPFQGFREERPPDEDDPL